MLGVVFIDDANREYQARTEHFGVSCTTVLWGKFSMSISLANLMLLLRGCIPPRALGCIYESLCDAYRLPHNATEHPLNENEVTNSSLLLNPIVRTATPLLSMVVPHNELLEMLPMFISFTPHDVRARVHGLQRIDSGSLVVFTFRAAYRNVCYYHNREFGCLNGASCASSHLADHLSMSDHRTGKNVCLNFLLDKCKFRNRCRYHHPVFPARESGASCGCKDYRKPHTHDLAAFWGNWNRKKLRKHWKNVRKNNGRRGKALALHVKAAISSAQPQGRVETKAYVLSPVEAGASDTEYPTGGRGLMRRHTTGGH